MKNNFFIACAFTFVSAGLMAQPTLTSTSGPAVGFTFSTSEVNLGTLTEGSSGANITWDLSSAIDTGAVQTYDFVEPSTLPDFASFPTANLAYSGSIQGSNFSVYIRNSASAFELLGSVVASDFGNFVVPYTNPRTLLGYPTTFNTTISDSYKTETFFDFGIGNSTTSTTGNQSYEVDGYGTLTTSVGTYNNILRLKRYDVSFDTTESTFNGEVQPPNYSESRSLSYEWVYVSNGESIPVFVIRRDTSITGAGETYSSSASHSYSNEFTGIETSSNSDFMLFPNPTEGKFVATVSNQINKIEICDITGKTVQTFVPDADQLNDLQEFDITNLPAGIYWVRQMGESATITKKLVRR